MFQRKPRRVRGVQVITERDMWQFSKGYRWRSGKYYGRIRQ
ncbi:hypothetical protein [Serratia fonticola]